MRTLIVTVLCLCVIATAQAQTKFSQLDVRIDQVDGKRVIVQGETDLPDETALTMFFRVTSTTGEEHVVAAMKDGEIFYAFVTDGSYQFIMTSPYYGESSKDLKPGPLEPYVLLNPKVQPDEIQSVIGEEGENISDKLTMILLGRTFFGNTAIEHNVKKYHPPVYRFDEPSEFPDGSAQHTLARFIAAWKAKDWATMAALAQKTWLAGESDPIGLLEAWFDIKNLLSFEILDVNCAYSSCKIPFIVEYYVFDEYKTEKHKIVAQVICESAPYKVDGVHGDFGVNPTSCLAEEPID